MSLMGAMILSVVLFVFGLAIVLIKKNVLVMLVGIELMFNAANLNLVAFNKKWISEGMDGQLFTLFVLAIVAAEVALALAIVLKAIKQFGSSDIDGFNELRG